MPKVPPAASEPADNFALYPRFLSCGYATLPIVAAVATLDPLIAANIAHEAMLVCSKPPGIGATSLAKPTYVR